MSNDTNNIERKEAQLKTWLASPLRDGDVFWLNDIKCRALALNGANMVCTEFDSTDHTDGVFPSRFDVSVGAKSVNYKGVRYLLTKKAEDYEGVNPFMSRTIDFKAFGLDSILSMIGYDRRKRENDGEDMPYFNWEPYFIIDGQKVHYQRGFVWTLEQKQALITTIYRNLECGRMIVHCHSWSEQERMVKAGYTDFASRDIVDGKQRLSTILEFIENKFPDEYGNYYSDLSAGARRRFYNYQGLMYGEMSEHCSYEQVCDAFINNAVGGTPIAKDHIEFMLGLRNNLKGGND